MAEAAESTALLVEYEELLRYCPMLTTDPETARGLDKHTIQVLSSAARSNCEERRANHCRKIQQAKARGARFGRPRAKIPANFPEIVDAWRRGTIPAEEAIRQSGMASATFYRYARELREKG